MPDIGDFIRRLRGQVKIAIVAPGTPSDFQRSVYKIARCVAGFRESQRPNIESKKLSRNFQRGVGLLWLWYGYFLELHILQFLGVFTVKQDTDLMWIIIEEARSFI